LVCSTVDNMKHACLQIFDLRLSFLRGFSIRLAQEESGRRPFESGIKCVPPSALFTPLPFPFLFLPPFRTPLTFLPSRVPFPPISCSICPTLFVPLPCSSPIYLPLFSIPLPSTTIRNTSFSPRHFLSLPPIPPSLSSRMHIGKSPDHQLSSAAGRGLRLITTRGWPARAVNWRHQL